MCVCVGEGGGVSCVVCVCVLELPELLHGLWRPERPERGRCKLCSVCVCVLGKGEV